MIRRHMNLYFGTFNSELYWQESDYAQLPSVTNNDYENIVFAMDEVQAVFVKNPSDTLITKLPFDLSLKQYFKELGIDFKHNLQPLISDWSSEINQSVCELLIEKPHILSAFDQKITGISPYSILSTTQELCKKYDIQTNLP